MQIWVDADACPGEIKELLFRAARRTKIKVTLVANQPIRVRRSEFIGNVLVGDDMNAADRRIVELLEPGDLVITDSGIVGHSMVNLIPSLFESGRSLTSILDPYQVLSPGRYCPLHWEQACVTSTKSNMPTDRQLAGPSYHEQVSRA